jgi:hypothetical protein
MSKINISMDEKRPDQFLIETDADVSLFGWETKSKFCSYYMNMSPWNLSDLFTTNKTKLGHTIIYDDRVLPIIENLRNEIKLYKDAASIKNLPIDDINDMWEEQSFPYLFPKIEADMHQKRMVLWALKAKKVGCFAEQGTGKTPIGIFILGKLLHDGLIRKPIVFAPLSLLNDNVWFKDLRQFSDFKPFNLRDPDNLFCDGQISFINYDKLQNWCFEKTKTGEHSYIKDNFFEMQKFDAIYYDESSSLKGHSSYRTRAFIKISKYAKYISLASGTVAPNSIFQIWGQMKALGSVLGDSYSQFESRYGAQRSIGPVMKYFPRYNAEQEIRKRIDLVSYFIKRSDVYDLPLRSFVTINVDLHEDHMKLYKKIEKDYISAVQGFGDDGEIIDGKLRIQHEVAVRIRLMQIMNGFTVVEDKNGKIHRVSLPWNAKLEALDNFITKFLAESDDNNIIVWATFRWEIETIYNKYKDIASYIYGGLNDTKRNELLDRWLNDKSCRIMVAMPQAAMFGHTWLKSNASFYYSCTENYEFYAQSHDRNYRRGLTREVTEYKLVTSNTIESKIWAAVKSRKKLDKFLKDYYLEKAKSL